MCTLPAVPCLLGPTASGKSEVALHVARALGAEVIACDAFSVYRGMAVLSAAPAAPPDVPHHLVGVREPDAPWNAALFGEALDAILADLHARGRSALLVGGTALYLKTWLKGFGASVPRDDAFRQALRARAAALGTAALHRELEALDPVRAAAVHPNDLTRIVRALEIRQATGHPAQAPRREWDGPDRRAAHLVGLRRTPEDLAARIGHRTEAMFAAGVAGEAARLLARPLSPEAQKVLGLDVLAALLAGRLSEAAARERLARLTRRLARKQMTFFRSFPGVAWLDVPREATAEATAERVLAALAERGAQAGGTSA